MLPVVVEVIAIEEPFSLGVSSAQRRSQIYGSAVRDSFFLVPGRIAIDGVAELEFVEMAVRPVEHGLNCPVEAIQADAGWGSNAPPHRRLDVPNLDLEVVYLVEGFDGNGHDSATEEEERCNG